MLLFKRISLLACFCLLAGVSMSQTKPLVGQVLDSLNRPIAYANVVAINQGTQKIAGFGISNNEGKFKVTLLEGPSYLIRVSFVGYRQYEQALNSWDSDTPQLVILKQSDTQLGLV
ncbi:MAG: carboxypeptidase regulatory-like domain-containing protein, partial [Bacteroidetes bacterium]|nr:carboxypeptidase regulatory-like domain-containing protein [Bacteroidota bacterium]